MIIVTGTMRSGTSLWMQILVRGGLKYIGDSFPKPWGSTLRAANPEGFYESQLLAGIYFATNPHPETGAFLPPETTRTHAVKVFIPGVVRTDLAYLSRLIGTVRPWREFTASLHRMREMGDPSRGGKSSDLPLPPALRWWVENFALIRDIATRGYPAHVATFDRLLRDPAKEVATVFRWLEVGDSRAAIPAVDATLRTQSGCAKVYSGLGDSHEAVFDELYDFLDRGRDLSPAFVKKLNATDAALRPHIVEARDRARKRVLDLSTRTGAPNDT